MNEITEATIVGFLRNNNNAVERAIVVIYNNQTQDEKSSSATKEHNGKGFSGTDAAYGSYLARWILKGNNLTGNHLEKARKMAIKYRKQLLEVALAKAGQKKKKAANDNVV